MTDTSKKTPQDTIKREAEAFDAQTRERIKAGFIPDLRRLQKVDWFYNNIWRDPAFANIYLMPKVNFVIDIAREKGGRVLELGCGYGYLSLELARNGLQVLGMDVSSESIRVARQCASQNTFIDHFGALDYERADILQIDLGEDAFDSIVFFSSLHHMPDITLLFPKVYKTLKKGGALIIVEPVRGEFTKKSAECAALLRLLLPTYMTIEEKQALLDKKPWEEYVQDIFDEYTFKGEHEQSPNDNATNTAEAILEATKKYFSIRQVHRSGAFLEKMIGALRGENAYKLAELLHRLDEKLVQENVLPGTHIQLHAVKE